MCLKEVTIVFAFYIVCLQWNVDLMLKVIYSCGVCSYNDITVYLESDVSAYFLKMTTVTHILLHFLTMMWCPHTSFSLLIISSPFCNKNTQIFRRYCSLVFAIFTSAFISRFEAHVVQIMEPWSMWQRWIYSCCVIYSSSSLLWR